MSAAIQIGDGRVLQNALGARHTRAPTRRHAGDRRESARAFVTTVARYLFQILPQVA
jgi:hypothetical protein